MEINIYLKYVFCVALGELEAHPEQFLLHGLVEGDLVAVHGAGDEPHGQVIIAGEGEEEAIKPRWMDQNDLFRNRNDQFVPSILIFLYSDKIINYSKLFLESKINSCKAFVKRMT